MSAATTVPVLPLHGPKRLAWLNSLDEAVALDVFTSGDELLELGVSRDQIPETLRDFARYLSDRLSEAVAMSVDVWSGTR